MAIILRNISNICRLCLNDDEVLFPATNILDSGLTSEDVERCTGIQLFDESNIFYAVCIECHNKVQKFTAYRSCCMNNDVRFRRLYPMIFEKLVWDEETGPEECLKADTVDHSYCVETYENPPEEESVTEEESAAPVDLPEEIDPEYEELVELYAADDTKVDVDVDIIEEIVLETNADVEIIPQESGEETFLPELPPVQEATVEEADLQEDNACVIESNACLQGVVELSEPSQQQQATDEPQIAQQSPEEESDYEWMEEPKAAEESTAKGAKGSRPKQQLCTLCGKLVSYLRDHMITHTKEQKYACDRCPFVSSRKANLKTHVQNVHFKRVIRRCEKCDRGFSYVDSYNAHMRAKHNLGEYFECKICSKKFRHRGGLNGHLNRKHNEESNCTCPVCGFVCQDKKGLKDHSRVHSNEKPFVCRHCPKAFKSTYARRTHELIHKGVVFSCTVCEKSYRYKSQLVLHSKKHNAQPNTQQQENER